MDSLLAVEDHLLLVFFGLGLLGVHGGQRNVGDLAVSADLDTEGRDKNAGDDRDGDGL